MKKIILFSLMAMAGCSDDDKTPEEPKCDCEKYVETNQYTVRPGENTPDPVWEPDDAPAFYSNNCSDDGKTVFHSIDSERHEDDPNTGIYTTYYEVRHLIKCN
jgi:hypothetical protein